MIFVQMMNLLLLVLTICVVNSQGRIWFAGDIMPGTNRTILEESSSTPSWAPPINVEQLDTIIGRGVNRMALSMENSVGTDRDNLVFAPVSVAAALSVILLGAAGVTSAEIASFLGLLAGVDFKDRTQIVHSHLGRYFTRFAENPGVDIGTQLVFANGVFVQEGFPIKPKFDELARQVYRCEVFPLNFWKQPEYARNFVNQWVANRTGGHIKHIISGPLSPMTSVVVANALYFKGEWEHPFFGRTKTSVFHVSKEETIPMPMMVNGAEVPYHQTKQYRILGMPYKGGDLLMYIVLPQANLHSFISNLTVDSIENMINLTKVQSVIFAVPRMKLESSINLRKPLEDLGIHSLFDAKSSDLSGISEGVFVSNIYHKVEIEVTETGTVASAGTAAGLIRGGVPTMRVDKPFLFFIYHKPTSTVIFWGSVYKPAPFYS